MCLVELENFKVTQDYGWQVLRETTGMLYSCFFGEGPVPVGKWQRDKFRIRDRWICANFMKYKKGFHIFLNKEDAKTYCNDSEAYRVKKVRFKRVVARGFQDVSSPLEMKTQLAKVVVCRKRFVEPN